MGGNYRPAAHARALCALALAGAVSLVVAAPASAGVTCDFDSKAAQLDIGEDDDLVHELSLQVVAGTITVEWAGHGPVTCGGAPTTTNTDTINISFGSGLPSTSNHVQIEDPAAFAPGATAEVGSPSEIEVHVDLAGNRDTLTLLATAGNDHFASDAEGIDTNRGAEAGDVDDDILLSGVSFIEVYMREGEDVFSGRGAGGLAGPTSRQTGIRGGAGDDLLLGGSGRDSLSGDGGEDTLKGMGGRDALRGYGGDDLLLGGDGDDYMRGGPGTGEGFVGDVLEGGDGDDLVAGGAGDDRLTGDAGRDRILGKEGVDHIFAKDGMRDARIDCGPGANAQETARFDGGVDLEPHSC